MDMLFEKSYERTWATMYQEHELPCTSYISFSLSSLSLLSAPLVDAPSGGTWGCFSLTLFLFLSPLSFLGMLLGEEVLGGAPFSLGQYERVTVRLSAQACAWPVSWQTRLLSERQKHRQGNHNSSGKTKTADGKRWLRSPKIKLFWHVYRIPHCRERERET